MPDRYQTYPISFRGGLVTNVSRLEQGIQLPGSATTLTNFEPSIDGGYRRIEGFTKYDPNEVPGTSEIRGVFYFNDAAFAVRNQHIYSSGGSGWTQITTSATLDISGTGIVRFEKLNYTGANTLIIVDGLGYPYRYKSTVFEELTSLPADTQGSSFAINFQNHLFLANESSIIFSSPYNEADFSPASGGGSIDLDDGSDITGIRVFRDQLIVFTERSIYQLTGRSVADFKLDPITRDLGCTEPDTIQEVGGDIMFLAPDGLRLLSATERNNDFGLAVVSRPIQKDLINFLSRHTTFSSLVVRAKSQYRIFGYNAAFTSSASEGIISVLRSPQGGEGIEFAKLNGINARVAYSDYIENVERVLFANSDGYVYNMESGNSFDGDIISATFTTPFLPIQDPMVRKQLHKVDIYTDPQGSIDVDVAVKYDYEKTGVLQPSASNISNTAGENLAIYGEALYAAEDATADVNGAVSASTNIILDNNVGTIAVGMSVSGSGITGRVTVDTVTDQNNIVLSETVTLTDDTSLVFTENTSEVFTFGGQLQDFFEISTVGSGEVISLQFTSDSTVPTFSLESAALQFLTSGRR